VAHHLGQLVYHSGGIGPQASEQGGGPVDDVRLWVGEETLKARDGGGQRVQRFQGRGGPLADSVVGIAGSLDEVDGDGLGCGAEVRQLLGGMQACVGIGTFQGVGQQVKLRCQRSTPLEKGCGFR